MANGKSVSLQVVLRKLENIEVRVKKLELEHSIPRVRLSDKEMAELGKSRREIKSGKYLTEEQVFKLLRK